MEEGKGERRGEHRSCPLKPKTKSKAKESSKAKSKKTELFV